MIGSERKKIRDSVEKYNRNSLVHCFARSCVVREERRFTVFSHRIMRVKLLPATDNM